MVFTLGLCLVSLTDPSNICNETKGGSHVPPGMEVALRCNVIFISNDSYKLLTWTLPVKGESVNADKSHTSGKLYLNYSMYLSNATFKEDSAHANLTFITMQSLDDRVVTCKDSSGDSEDCTLLINSEFTFTVKFSKMNYTSWVK